MANLWPSFPIGGNTNHAKLKSSTNDAGDIGTNDLYARIVQIYEKQEWWLRDILKKGDGLVS